MTKPSYDAANISYDFAILWKNPSGDTYRFANRELIQTTSQTYQPTGGASDHDVEVKGQYTGGLRVKSCREAISGELFPSWRFGGCDIEITRTGTEFDALALAVESTANFSNLTAFPSLFVFARGTEINLSTDLLFLGRIEPHSATVSRSKITFRLDDYFRYFAEKIIEAPAIDITDFTNPDPDIDGFMPAIIIGHQTGVGLTTDERPWIEAACVESIDNPANWADYRFKICEPGSNGVDLDLGAADSNHLAHLRADGTCVGIYQIDDTGTSDADGIVAISTPLGVPAPDIWAPGDRFLLCCHDVLGDLDSLGALIENPADIIYWLLTEYASVPAAKIDASWEDIRDELDTNLTVNPTLRRIITEPTPLMDLIDEICKSSGLWIASIRGKIHIGFHRVWRQASAIDIWPGDCRGGSVDLASVLSGEMQDGVRFGVALVGDTYPQTAEISAMKDFSDVTGSPPIPAEWYWSTPMRLWATVEGDSYFNRYLSPAASKNPLEFSGRWLYDSSQATIIAEDLYFAASTGDDAMNIGGDIVLVKRGFESDIHAGAVLKLHDPSGRLFAVARQFMVVEIDHDVRGCTSQIKLAPCRET